MSQPSQRLPRKTAKRKIRAKKLTCCFTHQTQILYRSGNTLKTPLNSRKKSTKHSSSVMGLLFSLRLIKLNTCLMILSRQFSKSVKPLLGHLQVKSIILLLPSAYNQLENLMAMLIMSTLAMRTWSFLKGSGKNKTLKSTTRLKIGRSRHSSLSLYLLPMISMKMIKCWRVSKQQLTYWRQSCHLGMKSSCLN